MSKLVLYTICSLDGAVDDPTRTFPTPGIGPAPPTYDADMERFEARLLAGQKAVLLGRGMYDQWSHFWPRVTDQPFAEFINRVPKYVLTSSPLTTDWPTSTAVSGPLPDLVAGLKARTEGDIGVHGSITLAQSLLAADLVDELQLAVGPVLDATGRRLSDSLAYLRRLTLVSAEPTVSGALWLTYRSSAATTADLPAV